MEDKSKITFVEKPLKLRDVVNRARLDLWTAQHVLKHAGLPGMPDAGSQGKHRVFSLDQAMRFALATQLVMGGVPVKFTAGVVDYCERHVKSQTTGWKKGKPLYESPENDWNLEIWDCRYVEVQRRKEAGMIDDDSFFLFAEGRMVDMFRDVDSPISMHAVHLSKLERELRRQDRA